MADCVTSLGGIELRFDDWGIDFAYSCSQKCVGAPPGMSPVAVSDRALERIAARTHPVPYALDLSLLRKYWVDRPLAYHHTTPVLNIYSLHEALREVAIEGLDARWARHMDAGRFLQDEVRARGLALLAEPDHQLPQLTAVRVPEGVDGKAVTGRLLADHGIEIGGGLAGAPPMWRIGLMGVNASRETATRVLDASGRGVGGRAGLRCQRLKQRANRKGTGPTWISRANLQPGITFRAKTMWDMGYAPNRASRTRFVSRFPGRRSRRDPSRPPSWPP